MKIKNATGKPKWVCRRCGKVFSRRGTYLLHQRYARCAFSTARIKA